MYLTEDDGEVDLGFPCLEPAETIGKFEFSTLGLLEMKPSDLARQCTVKIIPEYKEEQEKLEKTAQKIAQDLATMEIHTNAMEASTYHSYRFLVNFFLKKKK